MNTIDVTCAIITLDNKILAVQRAKQMKLPMKWEFPCSPACSGGIEMR